MKRILTITTHFANNQGAILQCYALNTFLSTIQGIDCQVIDYYPEKAERSWQLFPKPKTFKELIKNIYTLFNIKYIIGYRRKRKVMRAFIKEYIVKTPRRYDKQSLMEQPPIADYYICGSDQIWNFTLFNDMSYYLDFVDKIPNAKRIAYAASISDAWTEKQQKQVSPLLNKFSQIFIREKGNIAQVNECVVNKGVQWVCDPVFLISTSKWDELAIEVTETEPYILCYFLNIDPKAIRFVNKIKQLTGYKVINLALGSREKFKSDRIITAYTPSEFIGYIKNAAFIITNSFHCSAFASMYRKNFRFIPKNSANERLISLEELYGYKVIMTPEMIDKFTLKDLPTDYSQAEKMDEFIANSKRYLLQSIDE